MSAPTIYYYDDPGAPVVTPGADSFYQIMRACLIDGYGSKTAAGWSVVYDDWATNGVLTITNALQTGILGLKRFDEVSFGPGLFVCEAMIDSVTPANARSGYNELTTLDDLTDSNGYQRAQFSSAPHEKWVVIANENTVFFWNGPDSGLFGAQNQSNGAVSFLGFGALQNDMGLSDLAVGNFAIIGGNHRLNQVSSYSYSMFYDAGEIAGNGGHSTSFYLDGAYAQGLKGTLCWPFASVNHQRQAGNTRYMPLSAVYMTEFSTVSYNEGVGSGVGQWPMLLSSHTISGRYSDVARTVVQNYFASNLASLRDTVVLGGKTLTVCSCGWYLYAFVSLDASDWL